MSKVDPRAARANPMFDKYWASVGDGGPTFIQL